MQQNNEELKAEMSQHQAQLAALKERDPEFYAYLQQTDQALLDFEGDDDDSDKVRYGCELPCQGSASLGKACSTAGAVVTMLKHQQDGRICSLLPVGKPSLPLETAGKDCNQRLDYYNLIVDP